MNVVIEKQKLGMLGLNRPGIIFWPISSTLTQAQADVAVNQAVQPSPPSDEDRELERQQALRSVIQELRRVIVGLADEIYQMPLTEEQVSELADKMLHQVAEAMNEITIERVKDIANDLLIGVEEVRSKKRRKTY